MLPVFLTLALLFVTLQEAADGTPSVHQVSRSSFSLS